MKKEYINPEAEVIVFGVKDVITTSSLGGNGLPENGTTGWTDEF